MHNAQREAKRGIGQVRVERLQLRGGEHALVDHGRGGERREVHAELVLGALAHAEGPGVKVGVVLRRPAPRKSWAKCGMQARARGADEAR